MYYMAQKSFDQGQKHSVPNVQSSLQMGGSGLHPYPLSSQVHHISDWRRDPRINRFRGLVRSQIAEILKWKAEPSRELDQRASKFAQIMENKLFMQATSKEEYLNKDIRMRRIRDFFGQETGTNPIQANQSSSPNVMIMPTVVNCWKSDVPNLPFSYSKDSGISCISDITMSSGQFAGRMDLDPVQASSSTTYSTGEGFTGSGAVENGPGISQSSIKYTSNSESLNGHLQQQYLHQGELNLPGSRSCVPSNQNIASLVYPSTLEETVESSTSYFQDSQCNLERNPEVSNCFPCLVPDTQSSTLEDVVKPYLQFTKPDTQSVSYSFERYGSCSRMTGKNAPQLSQLSKEQLNISPSMVSDSGSSTLADVLQSQSLMLKFQGNEQLPGQPHLQFHKPFEAQSQHYLVKQYDSCSQMAGYNSCKQPQLSSEQLYGVSFGASENSALLYGNMETAKDGTSSYQLDYSMKRKILLAYFYIKSAGTPIEENKVSFVNVLHSTLCDGVICLCENYWQLLTHFDNCQYAGCHTCGFLSDKKHNHAGDFLLGGYNDRVPNSNNCEDMLHPLKRQKMENLSGNGVLQELAPRTVQTYAPEGLPHLEQWPASPISPTSPISINSEVKDLNIELLTNAIQDGKDLADNLLSLIAGRVPISPADDICAQAEERDSTNINEIQENAVDDSSTLRSKIVPSASENLDNDLDEELLIQIEFKEAKVDSGNDLSIPESDHERRSSAENQNMSGSSLVENFSADLDEELLIQTENLDNDLDEELLIQTEFEEAKVDSGNDPSIPESDNERRSSAENQNMSGSSLIENFSADQIKEHVHSLRQWIQDESENITIITVKENTCQLCLTDKLPFAPTPIYCSYCSSLIKRSVMYYCTPNENGMQHCFCTKCYRGIRGGSITFCGITVSKANLSKRKNDEHIEESWVQCDTCEGWQHQICALYNDKSDLEGKAKYICPKCCLKEIETHQRTPLPDKAVFSAKDLPSTMLSNHLEQRLFRRLKEEREERAKVTGKNLDEVPEAKDLVIRVVLSVDKHVTVKNQFLDIFQDRSYPENFQYRSKVILLFQKIDGVDVCLFSMYVQEYGSECSHPNQRCVYISYLDSVKYFRPNTQTATGEALRTFVYHEILIGYLEYCKKRGFVTCYIWACPPVRGEDYILYCHPQIQKTPKSDKLRQWYQSLLRKAEKAKIVVDFTNLYDHFFVPTGEWKTKITAARIPYFDGDYWSGSVERWIRDIEKECGGDTQQVKKLMTNRTLKAMGLTNPSTSSTKEILIMKKLGNSILPTKEDFIVVHLQFVCTQCHEVILRGQPWFCKQCKSFQLCERCHDSSGKDTHSVNNKEEHLLHQVRVDDVPSDTKDNDLTLSNNLFENRHSFLSFCQRNHYQFDTVRRAKHSSMMILHELRDPTVLMIVSTCSICHKDTLVDQSWKCEMCPNFCVCATCHQELGGSCHVHKLVQHSSKPTCWTENKEAQQKASSSRELVDLIQHASQCHQNKSNPCSYPNCAKIKKLFAHASRCSLRSAGGCESCKKVWLGLSTHSRNCRDPDCLVPRCKDLKKHAEWLTLQSDTRRRAAVTEAVRQEVDRGC